MRRTTGLVTMLAAAVVAGVVFFGFVAGASAPSAGASDARISISNSLGDIYSVGVEDGRLRKLTPSGRFDSWPVTSPAGQRIAFGTISSARVNDAGLRSTLSVMRIDGTQPRGLAPGLFQPTDVAWSRDGRYLAFKAIRWSPPFTEALHITDLTLGRVRRVAASQHAILPEWSRGGLLAYTDVGPDSSAVIVVTANGKQLWRRAGSFQGWSPDGTRLAVVRGQATLILDRRGRQLASFRGGRPLAWAPDGQKIAFVRGAPSTLWVATLRNHNLRRIALNPATSQTPLWSPDSRQLAYVAQISRQPLRDGTYVSAADGSRRHVVPTTPYTMPWAWTSNRDLFVSRWDSKNYDFAVIPITGGPATVLARFPADYQLAAQLSPDRRTVVIFHASR